MPLRVRDGEEADGQTAGRDLEGVRRAAIVRVFKRLVIRADHQGWLLRGYSNDELADNEWQDGRSLAVGEMTADKAGGVLAIGR